VNGIAPGYFRTELTADLFADSDRAAWVLDRIPMGRLGDPADLAGAVVFLLSLRPATSPGSCCRWTAAG
jgi:NAD(P)-dependent dehydrogenase (short-subunit alcohol dehydrogenase family)